MMIRHKENKNMIYRVAWIGLGLAVTAGVMYLGAVGITVAKRPVQIEVPIQYFVKK
ncbi:MAG: hypothetical protein LBQ43_02620 [Holosporales bacterium]|jgi:cytochrome oxidase assembly protein ShyY1|nr:hypothetical protein [Holosporales bacterium]